MKKISLLAGKYDFLQTYVQEVYMKTTSQGVPVHKVHPIIYAGISCVLNI